MQNNYLTKFNTYLFVIKKKKTSQITDRRKSPLSDKGYLQKNPTVDIILDDILSMNTFP